jgi:Rhs element Vgr protein
MDSIKSEIFSNGKPVSSSIVSMDIMNSVNKIPYARIVVAEGGEKSKSLIEMSNEACFEPGREIEVSLSHGAEVATFKGIVVKHNLKKTDKKAFLTIDVRDKAHTLSLIRENAVFVNKEDKQIIADIAKKAAVDVECSQSTLQHKQIVQYYCTNWDFIVSRAEANGLLVCVENGVIKLLKPDLPETSTAISEIYEYEIEADLGSQYQEVESICWDIKEVKPGRFQNTNQNELTGKAFESKHDFNSLSSAMGSTKYTLVNGVYGEKEEMEAWANATLMKNRHSLLRGRISIKGNPALKLGDGITIGGLGNMFNGKALITGIRHRINNEGWITDIQCGLSRQWFYKNDDIIEKPAAGLLPGINGLQIGVVEAYPEDGDPDKLYRIKIRIPAIDEKESVIWARLIFPYAGAERGSFWVPEAGDEVVVGFFNDDPRHAVVLGSLYNGTAKPPFEFTEENNPKGIITRNGIKVIFTDETDKEKLEIFTPGGNKALFEDENGITVEDKNQNKITLHDQGVTFEDKNKNKIITDDKGTVIEDVNKNALTFNNEGIEIKDLNGNTIVLSSAGIELKDMSGNKAVLEAGGITVQSSANVTVKGTMINLN